MDIFPILLQEVSEDTIDKTSATSGSGKLKTQKSGSKISAIADSSNGNGSKVLSTAQNQAVVQKGQLSSTSEHSQLEVAAQEFESIFVTHLLSTMRESATQTDFLGENSTSMKIFNGMLDEKYAMEIAKTGQLGLAEMLIQQLEGYQTKSLGDAGTNPDPNLETVEGLAQQLGFNMTTLNLPALLSELNIEQLDGLELETLVQQVIERFSQMAGDKGTLPTESLVEITEDLTNLVNSDFVGSDASALPMAVDTSQPFQPELRISMDSESAIDGSKFAIDAVVDAESANAVNAVNAVNNDAVSSLDYATTPNMESTSSIVVTSQEDRRQEPEDYADAKLFGIIEESVSQATLQSERIIVLPPAENMSQASFISAMANGALEATPESLSQLRQLQLSLQQENVGNQPQSQRGLHLQQRIQVPQFEMGRSLAEPTPTTQNMVLSWNQIQSMDTTSLANMLSGIEGETALPTQVLSADRVVIQIADKLQPHLGRGFQQAIIDLEPPSLGRVHIRLLFEDSTLSAQIQVRNGMVSEIVKGNLAQLRNVLSEQGIQIDNFQVMSNDSGQQGDQFRGWEQDFGYRQYQGSDQSMDRDPFSVQSDSNNNSQTAGQISDLSVGINHLV